MVKQWLKDHVIGFIAIALALNANYIANDNYESGMKLAKGTCEAENKLRADLNDRIEFLEISSDVLQKYIETAAQARSQAALLHESKGEDALAEVNRNVSRDWRLWNRDLIASRHLLAIHPRLDCAEGGEIPGTEAQATR